MWCVLFTDAINCGQKCNKKCIKLTKLFTDYVLHNITCPWNNCVLAFFLRIFIPFHFSILPFYSIFVNSFIFRFFLTFFMLLFLTCIYLSSFQYFFLPFIFQPRSFLTSSNLSSQLPFIFIWRWNGTINYENHKGYNRIQLDLQQSFICSKSEPRHTHDVWKTATNMFGKQAKYIPLPFKIQLYRC
jgi:hypothetical protein